ncbi:MAG TPA: helix-turn-helix domain-containing protein [Nitrososphaerales archaeon]|nr:helix-turn-helix domain-containing protein [Nitrososphaerales archaeon]
MNRLGELLGSRTRGNVVEALALSEKPLTAYRVAKSYNMNVAKVYREMKKLSDLGMLKASSAGPAREYELADEDLKDLALKLSSRVLTYSSWRSMDSKRERFRMGLQAVPEFAIEAGEPPAETRKALGELENLATLGRSKFDAKYRRKSGREYARL